MHPRYMLDTDICIHIRARRRPAILRHFETLSPGDVVMSAVTYGELRLGVEKSPSRQNASRLLAGLVGAVRIEPLMPKVGEDYADIRATLERDGEIIGPNDLWIAAHARSMGLTLVTSNEREFRRVPGLKVENWAVA